MCSSALSLHHLTGTIGQPWPGSSLRIFTTPLFTCSWFFTAISHASITMNMQLARGLGSAVGTLAVGGLATLVVVSVATKAATTAIKFHRVSATQQPSSSVLSRPHSLGRCQVSNCTSILASVHQGPCTRAGAVSSFMPRMSRSISSVVPSLPRIGDCILGPGHRQTRRSSCPMSYLPRSRQAKVPQLPGSRQGLTNTPTFTGNPPPGQLLGSLQTIWAACTIMRLNASKNEPDLSFSAMHSAGSMPVTQGPSIATCWQCAVGTISPANVRVEAWCNLQLKF